MNFKKPKFWDHQRISYLSILLFPLSVIYSLINITFKILNSPKKSPIPVICVGNIYLGGTGKTPLVKEIFNIAKSLKKNPAIIKKYHHYLQDEIKMLKKTGTVFECSSRSKGIIDSANDNYDVAILDDGFQDYTINPNFSILCFNSQQLLGNGFIIPSGPLRESLNAISRANCIIINGNKNLEFENKILEKAGKKNIHIFYSKYKIEDIKNLYNTKMIAFAGIGNPSNFFNLLKENNLNVEKTFSFPDHHYYTKKDFEFIKSHETKKIVTTEKDYYRMNEEQKKSCDYIKVSLEIENKEELESILKKYL
tara:strand:- start:9609 stop:10535 length:927 start_codon:yes stop_codon:yes gene_type:complete